MIPSITQQCSAKQQTVNTHNLHQNDAGNCFFVAAIQAVLKACDNKVLCVQTKASLSIPERTSFPKMKIFVKYDPNSIDVKTDWFLPINFPIKTLNSLSNDVAIVEQYGFTVLESCDLWLAYLEKFYAKSRGGNYDAITEGGTVSKVWQTLFGFAGVAISLESEVMHAITH